ncbi:MAG: YegS/Rv2252/BmrU family lipid kinase [Oscillospiraceae bacterium]|jgi:YegS/Rv2252/BmrU family lipid kinase|nr:YegS/Rv2252/BmrU family lipid kinase [Oscillospiraceae bacterium]
MNTQHLFIINPTAGKKDITEQLTAKIADLNLKEKHTIKVTEFKGDALNYVREFVSGTDDFVRVYSCGGDGTLNEVINAVQGLPNCAVGVIPTGSGNDFARCFTDDPASLTELSRTVLNGEVKSVDCFKCGDIRCLNVVSVGFDTAVCKNMVRFKRWPGVSGSLAYKLAIVYCLFSKRRHKYTVFADGKKLDTNGKPYLLAVGGNGNYYGGGIKATPGAELDDGLIDLVYVTTVSVPTFAKMLGTFTRGEHVDNPKMPFVQHCKCKSFKIVADKPVDIGFDGEIYSINNPVVEVVPGGQKIIVPR